MISAEQARFKANFGKELKNLEAEIDDKIKKSAEKGVFYCCIDISLDTSEEIRTKIMEELKENGYKVSITNYKKTERNAPCDQSHWYDILKITWD